jgi:hypothetical protein
MATMIRGNQKIMVPDKKIEQFVERGWQLEMSTPTPKSKTKTPPKSKRIKPVEAVVEQQPVVDDDQHDFEQQNQGFIDDNFNEKEK